MDLSAGARQVACFYFKRFTCFVPRQRLIGRDSPMVHPLLKRGPLGFKKRDHLFGHQNFPESISTPDQQETSMCTRMYQSMELRLQQ